MDSSFLSLVIILIRRMTIGSVGSITVHGSNKLLALEHAK